MRPDHYLKSVNPQFPMLWEQWPNTQLSALVTVGRSLHRARLCLLMCEV